MIHYDWKDRSGAKKTCILAEPVNEKAKAAIQDIAGDSRHEVALKLFDKPYSALSKHERMQLESLESAQLDNFTLISGQFVARDFFVQQEIRSSKI
ncbi:MAG: hypothetical protein H6765_07325 [Candidatus Peribacteria bacterium]|nr:MAG: hypothetical protein H6765_07325 [Candidatus Peribacteria bacterium]